MLKEFTCIICPRGCVIEADLSSVFEDDMVAEGMGCRRGIEYVRQEVLNPQRTIATSVKVLNGSMPLVSVRVTKPVPKARIADVMDELRGVTLRAPVEAGQLVVRDVADTGSDVIATRRVPRLPEAQNRC